MGAKVYLVFPLAPPTPVVPVPGRMLRLLESWVPFPAPLPVSSVPAVVLPVSRGPLPLSTVGWVEGAWVGAELACVVAAVVADVVADVGAVVVLGVPPLLGLLRQPVATAITSTRAGISMKCFFIIITSIIIGFEPIISRKIVFTLVNMTTCFR